VTLAGCWVVAALSVEEEPAVLSVGAEASEASGLVESAGLAAEVFEGAAAFVGALAVIPDALLFWLALSFSSFPPQATRVLHAIIAQIKIVNFFIYILLTLVLYLI